MSAAVQAPEWERDARGFPLGYYVTVRDGGKVGWLLGPYRTHEEALGKVERGRELAEQADPFAHFYAFGTARAPERTTVFGGGEVMAARAAQPGLVASLPKMAAAEIRELAANYAVTGMGPDAAACDAEIARRRKLVQDWTGRAEQLERYAAQCRREGFVQGPEGAEDAEAAALDYRVAAEEVDV